MKNDDRGYSLIEMLVAMVLFAVLTTISSALLINTHKTFRDVDALETQERTYREFDEAFQTATRSALAVRNVGDGLSVVGSPSGKVAQSLRIDYYEEAAGCITFEVTKLNGKPDSTYTTNIDYFTWKRGRYATVSNKSTCAKQTPFAPVTWGSSRIGLNPPQFSFIDKSVQPILDPILIGFTTSGFDLAWYTKIARIEYTRTGRNSDSGIQSAANLPATLMKPTYG